MLKVKQKYLGQTLSILGVGLIDMDNVNQPILQVLDQKYPNKFTENSDATEAAAKPNSNKGKGKRAI
jgi:hypothetical protein